MKYLLVATMALALAACGSKSEDETASMTSAAGPRPIIGGNDSVAAVLDSQGTPVAQLRFVIDTRPVVNKPFRLQLLASATAPVSQIQLTAESDSLLIDPGNAVLELVQEEAASGGARNYSATHDLDVTAKDPGLAEVFVHLTTGPDTPETRYVIPVLVAKPQSAAPAQAPPSDKPDPAPEADNGQP